MFVRNTHHGTHVAGISQPYPSQHNTKHLSSSAELRYHSFACILIDRHRIEPLANRAPHLEELGNFTLVGKMAFRMAERNSSLVMEAHAVSINCPN